MSNPPRTELRRSRYRLLGLVGQGQFGRVFCAVHRKTGRLVALKNLEQQQFSTHKFLRELRFLLSLQHPNIVTCQALEHTSTGRYLVMDYCEGGTLRSLMSSEKCLDLPQNIQLVVDILLGLEHAHSRGVVHCDIKPENILLNLQPTGWTARISDFGIAKLSQELADQRSSNTGSPAYMAPERFYGQYFLTSDLYSVGIILFELMTGQRPFSGTPLELMSAHLNTPVLLPDSVPEIWRPLILTALQKLSGRRFRSASEMLAALRSTATASGLCLDRQIDLPQLQTQTAAVSDCLIEQQQLLQQRVNILAVGMQSGERQSDERQSDEYLPGSQVSMLYQAAETQIVSTCCTLAGFVNVDGRRSQEADFALPMQVRALLPRPQGCFAIAEDALYRLPDRVAEPPQAVAELKPGGLVAIEPQGRWMAIATTDAAGVSTLKIEQLSSSRTSVTVAAQLLPLARGRLVRLLQVIALDSRHVAVASGAVASGTVASGTVASGTVASIPLTAKQNQNSFGTLLEIFTRRGDRVGSLLLPVFLSQAITTLMPYRLLATEQNNPYSVLLIDLKPLRILRIQLDIVPEFLISSAWGYGIMDAQGEIVLLDALGQQIGRLKGPASPTAIAPIDSDRLLIATWLGDRGHLNLLNLRNQAIDLPF